MNGRFERATVYEDIPLKMKKWNGINTSARRRRGVGLCVDTINDVIAGNTD
jgi:hypothetical protein